MPSVIFIFGSTSGNTELVCSQVAQSLESADIKTIIQRAERSHPSDIENHDFCVLAASTYGHGIVQDHMIPFLKTFSKTNQAGQKFAVIGLGDSKYDADYNIESALIIEKAITDRDGILVTEALKIDKSPIGQSSKIDDWAQQLIKSINSSF